MSKNVIYLKSLFGKSKEDKSIIKMIDDAILNANGIPSGEFRKSEGSKDARDFILNNTEDFLGFALGYSYNELEGENFW